jgi:single-strand DNA-binding protein
MAGETQITVVGNLTSDPELRFTSSDAAVANFTVASTPRTLDRQSGEWRDGEAMFLRCSVWNQYAENVAESLSRGARVLVQGRLVQRSFETKEGEKRTVTELRMDEVGPALRYATVKINRIRRNGEGSPLAEDPWGSPPVSVPVRTTSRRSDHLMVSGRSNRAGQRPCPCYAMSTLQFSFSPSACPEGFLRLSTILTTVSIGTANALTIFAMPVSPAKTKAISASGHTSRATR